MYAFESYRLSLKIAGVGGMSYSAMRNQDSGGLIIPEVSMSFVSSASGRNGTYR